MPVFQDTTATQKVFRLKKRIRAVAGGTWASKTISILVWLIDYLQSTESKLVTVVAESVPHLNLGAIRDFKNIMQANGYWDDNAWNESKHIYTFPKGGIIEFISFDKFGKAHGPRRDVLFINEANNLPWNIVDQLITRTRDVIWMDWNPTNEFWFYSEMLNKRDDIDFITLTYLDNEALDEVSRKEIEAHRSNKSWWRVYGEGLLGEIEGRIYKGWEVIDEIPHEARLERYGVDFGYSFDPTAIIAIYYWNGGYILDEIIYQKELSNKQIADTLENMKKVLVVADSAEPKSIAEIKSFGINVVPCQKGKDSVRHGIKLIQDQRVSVTKRSVNLLKEYKNYLWEVDRDGRITINPQDIWNHCFAPDTLIYTVNGKKPIRELVGKTGFLFTRGGKVERFYGVKETRKNAETVKIEFNSGELLEITPDHLLLKPNGEWIEARLLTVGDMIQSVMYEGKNNFTDKTIIWWQKLLLGWKVFWQYAMQPKAFAQGSLGVSLWQNTRGISCPSQRRRSHEQPSKEFGVKTGISTFVGTYDTGKTAENENLDGQSKGAGKQVAWVKRGDLVSQVAWQEKLGEQETFREKLRSLPYKIYNKTFRHLPFLRIKLQNESKTKEIKRITRGFCPVTYNLEVEGEHCLLAGGVIAHNSLDAVRYAFESLIPIKRRDEYLRSLPTPWDKPQVNPAR